MNEKTLRGMTKTKLLEFIVETIKEINTIEQKHDEIIELKNELEKNDFLTKIRGEYKQSSETSKKITNAHREILKADGNIKRIMGESESSLDDLKKHIEEFDESRKDIFGDHTKDNLGGEITNKGYIADIKEKLAEHDKNYTETFQEYTKKYDEFYNKIDVELVSGATTVSLSKGFNENIQKYKSARRYWQCGLIGIFGAALYYFGAIYDPSLNLSGKELFFYFLRNVPIFSMFVWLIVFVGNRRAENLKLEEAYKHKEVMAKSFTGYKKSIEELSGDDKKLLIDLMGNLLAAIKKDSSDFLSSKGETHPVLEASKQVSK